MYEDSVASAMMSSYEDIWLVAGVRTPFADYMGTLRDVAPTDLGIAAARAVLAKSGVPATAVDSIVAGNMAQSCFYSHFMPCTISM